MDSNIEITKNNDKIFVTAGDVDFQNTLTELEKQYIHEGQNWISKLARETRLKELHAQGLTLDELQMHFINEVQNED